MKSPSFGSLLNWEISLENQKKGFGKKQGRNPQEISQLWMYCPHDGCFCCPYWSQPPQTLSTSEQRMVPALEDRADFQQHRKQWHKDMFFSIFSSLGEKPLDKFFSWNSGCQQMTVARIYWVLAYSVLGTVLSTVLPLQVERLDDLPKATLSWEWTTGVCSKTCPLCYFYPHGTGWIFLLLRRHTAYILPYIICFYPTISFIQLPTSL